MHSMWFYQGFLNTKVKDSGKWSLSYKYNTFFSDIPNLCLKKSIIMSLFKPEIRISISSIKDFVGVLLPVASLLRSVVNKPPERTDNKNAPKYKHFCRSDAHHVKSGKVNTTNTRTETLTLNKCIMSTDSHHGVGVGESGRLLRSVSHGCYRL